MPILLLVLADIAPGPTTTTDCEKSSDCSIVALAGCCATCCPPAPRAISQTNLAIQQSMCGAAGACPAPDCHAVKCARVEPVTSFEAVCRQNVCVAQRVGAPPAPTPETECVKDSECTMQPLPDCCGSCCPAPPSAHSVKDVEARRHRCAIVDCAAPRCAGVACEPVTESPGDLEALCRGGRCVSAHIAKAECARDSECRVDYPPLDENASCRVSPCGCCPNTQPIAVPTKTPRKSGPPPRPPRPLTKSDGQGVKFGLSPGSTPPPQCSPCPQPEPAKAICSEHHCVLDRPHAL